MKDIFALGLLLIAFSLSAASAQWVPPVGIPDPADFWGGTIDPIDDAKPNTATHCPSWPSAASATATGGNAYYIDKFHGSATDTANTYGYPDKPRLTIPYGKVYGPGDYVEIVGDGTTGNRYSDGVWHLAGAGTATAPIWFVGTNSANIGFSDAGFYNYADQGYYIFDGINWRNNQGAFYITPRHDGNNIHHVAFRNCKMIGDGEINSATGVSIGASTALQDTMTSNDILFYNCEVAWFGDEDAPAEECGIYPLMHLRRLWFVDGSVHTAEDGFGGSHLGQWTSSGYYIGRNDIYSNTTNAIDIKGYGANATDGGVIISENTMWDHWHRTINYTSGPVINNQWYRWVDVSGSPDFENVGAGAPPYTVDVWWRATASAEPTSWGTAQIYNEVSSGQGETVGLHTGGESTTGPEYFNSVPKECIVINNTIYDTRAAIWCGGIGNVTITGNVIYGTDSDGWPFPGGTTYTQVYDAIAVSAAFGDVRGAHNTIYDCDGGITLNNGFAAYSAATTYSNGFSVNYNNKSYTVYDHFDNPGTVTFDPATDTVTTSVPHGWSVNDHISFTGVGSSTAPTWIYGTTVGGFYPYLAVYVKSVPTTTTATLSYSLNGILIDINDAGTGVDSWNGIKNVLPTDTDHWREIATEVIGNVIADRPENNYDIKITGYSTIPDSFTMDYNLIYHATSEIYKIEGGTNRDLTWVQANTAYETNSLATDPLFVDEGNNHFALTASSPARDAAIPGVAYSDYASDYPLFGTIAIDRVGLARPDNGTWDIGAYEFGSDASGLAPSTPTPNLRLLKEK